MDKKRILEIIAINTLLLFVFFPYKAYSQTDIKELIEKLKYKNGLTRTQAREELTKIKDPRVTNLLINEAKDKNSTVRLLAIHILSQRREASAIEPLINLLQDEDGNIRQESEFALKDILGFHGGESKLYPLREGMSPQELAALEQKMKEDIKNNPIAEPPEAVLKEIKDGRVIELLAKLLQSKDKDVREKAVEVLGAIRDSRIIEPLISALKDKDSSVRCLASSVLKRAYIRDARVIEALISALKDENDNVRISAYNALCLLTHQRFPPQYDEWQDWFSKFKESDKELLPASK